MSMHKVASSDTAADGAASPPAMPRSGPINGSATPLILVNSKSSPPEAAADPQPIGDLAAISANLTAKCAAAVAAGPATEDAASPVAAGTEHSMEVAVVEGKPLVPEEDAEPAAEVPSEAPPGSEKAPPAVQAADVMPAADESAPAAQVAAPRAGTAPAAQVLAQEATAQKVPLAAAEPAEKVAAPAEAPAAQSPAAEADAPPASNGTNGAGIALYPHDALRVGCTWPADVDPAHREQHLDDADFLAAVGVSKDAFAGLPAWRRLGLKKAAGLF